MKLWTEDLTVLFKNMDRFWPSDSSSDVDRINSIMRYVLYCSIILSIYYKNPLIIVLGFICMITITKILQYRYKNCSKDKKIYKCSNNENKLPFDSHYEDDENDEHITNESCHTITNDPLNTKRLEKTFYKVPQQDTSKFQKFMFSDMSKKTNDYYKGYGGYGK